MHKLNFSIAGSEGKHIQLDFTAEETEPRPLVIFAHGFKGFKDWGTHNLVAEYFASSGFNFLKFNFSHNGIVDPAHDYFDDLEGFSRNTFSTELYDLDLVVTLAMSGEYFDKPTTIQLIGHSMGGAISIIYASENTSITKLCTWASISSFKNLWNAETEQQWKANGVAYFQNSRTNQQMPIYSSLIKDFEEHSDRLDVLAAARRVKQPWLIINGQNDLAVPLSQAEALNTHQPSSKLLIIPGADHVFGAQHPWTSALLPEQLKSVSDESIRFFK